MKTLTSVFLAFLVVLSMTACGGSDDAIVEDGAGVGRGSPTPVHLEGRKPYGVRGEIKRITAPVAGNEGSQGSLYVEGPIEDDTEFAMANILLSATTQYLRRRGIKDIPATFQDLAIGTRIEVKFRDKAIGGTTAIAVAAVIIILQ